MLADNAGSGSCRLVRRGASTADEGAAPVRQVGVGMGCQPGPLDPENFLADVSSRGLVVRGIGRGRTRVAVGMAYGPPAAWRSPTPWPASQPVLAGYVQLPAVRGHLLAELGRMDEARVEFTRAASLTRNERERAIFQARASACRGGQESS